MRVDVELGERSYAVAIDRGARHLLADLVATRAPDAQLAVVITPASLSQMPWFDLDPGVPTVTLTVPDGEAAKRFDVIEALCEQMSALTVSRRDIVVGVGGGATTDAAGFAAAVYLRGVALAQVPTTLVGQVDAAIGGKTAVDLAAGKNLVGAFHQPVGVLCDLDTLETLPAREMGGGRGEIAKCWILSGLGAEEVSSAGLMGWIAHAVELKAEIVSADEREGGRRALLNYGHTLAHSLEAVQLAGRDLDLLHGEAVAIGVAFAARLARSLGRVGDSVVVEHDAVLDAFAIPRTLPQDLNVTQVIEAMARDKKAHHDLSFVLDGPRGFETVHGVPVDVVRSALLEFEEECA